MRKEREKYICRELYKTRFNWVYDSLCHMRDLERTYAEGTVPLEMEQSRFVGSALMVSCLLNLIEQVHGPEECIMKNDECILFWTRNFLDAYDVPRVKQRPEEQ